MTLSPQIAAFIRSASTATNSVVLQVSAGGVIKTLVLPITPEDITIARPSRQAVTQTFTSAYQDFLGAGVATVTIRGHTGWNPNTRNRIVALNTGLGSGDGFTVMQNLKALLNEYDEKASSGNPSSVVFKLLFNIPNGWESFRVSKNTATFSRSRQSPMLFRYEIQFTVLEDYGSPTRSDPSPNFVIGPQSSLPGGSSMSPADIAAAIAAGARRTGLESSTVATGTATVTLATLISRWYPESDGWPNAKVIGPYIVAANPELFQNQASEALIAEATQAAAYRSGSPDNSGFDPNKFVIPANSSVRVIKFTNKDEILTGSFSIDEVIKNASILNRNSDSAAVLAAADLSFKYVAHASDSPTQFIAPSILPAAPPPFTGVVPGASGSAQLQGAGGSDPSRGVVQAGNSGIFLGPSGPLAFNTERQPPSANPWNTILQTPQTPQTIVVVAPSNPILAVVRR